MRAFQAEIVGLALASLLVTGAAARPDAMSVMPDCFDANYDPEVDLFTIRKLVASSVNQQCLIAVSASGEVSPVSRLTAGTYMVYLANGGDGGAGGTVQTFAGAGRGGAGAGGGGGGAGAGAAEARRIVKLTEGAYMLTIGAGGPGGNACIRGPISFSGGPGWAGSPSSIVRTASGEVVAGTPGADNYARPTRAQNERKAGKEWDGHGGSGPGQASGGRGGRTDLAGVIVQAQAGESKTASGQASSIDGGTTDPRPGVIVQAQAGESKTASRQANSTDGGTTDPRPGVIVQAQAGAGEAASGQTEAGGAPGPVPRDDPRAGAGGGGGATSEAHGGKGGGAGMRSTQIAPQPGSLGSGGGGGEGNSSGCGPGAHGGHGYIALRRI